MAEIKEEAESNKRVIYTYPMVKQVRDTHIHKLCHQTLCFNVG